jgi:hypothetical protein
MYIEMLSDIPVATLRKGDCFEVGWQEYCVTKKRTKGDDVHLWATQLETLREMYFIFPGQAVVAEVASW